MRSTGEQNYKMRQFSRKKELEKRNGIKRSKASYICRTYLSAYTSPSRKKTFCPYTSVHLVHGSCHRSPWSSYLLLHRRRCRFSFDLLLCILLTLPLLCYGAEGAATSADSPGEKGGGSSLAERNENWSKTTCYTCVNVSSNEECNRFAIDRPCPEGGDYCLTLHVMDKESSVLVNKRCASLDDCVQDAMGCTTNPQGQMQCVSCCDEPYCNDFAPSNSTNALFYRSSAIAIMAKDLQCDIVFRFIFALIPVFSVLILGGTS